VTPPGSATVRDPGGNGIAVDLRIDSAAEAVSDGFVWHIKATMPATCGVAIDVPLK